MYSLFLTQLELKVAVSKHTRDLSMQYFQKDNTQQASQVVQGSLHMGKVDIFPEPRKLPFYFTVSVKPALRRQWQELLVGRERGLTH